MKAKFKKGNYVKDSYGDIYYVIDIDCHPRLGQLLHLEDWRTGNTSAMNEARFFEKCRKPKTCKQEVKALCDKYGEDVAGCCTHQGLAMRRFAKDLVKILRKHGDSIHNQF